MKRLTRNPPVFVATFVAGCSVVSAFGLSLFAVSDAAPAPVSATPATGSPSHGREFFVQSCAHCHGDDAHGSGEDGDGPDLFHLRIGNARIAAIIRAGIPEEMPSFAKKYGASQVADLTAYLRTLQ